MSVNLVNPDGSLTVVPGTETGGKNFVGTLEQWNALTDAQKAQYDTYDIIDEFNGIPIDSAFSATSSNPVQNKVVKQALDGKQDTLTFDNSPTANSDNPVKSGGVYTALEGKQGTLTFDNSPTANSNNPVKSGGIKTALDAKQDKLNSELQSGTLAVGSTSITLTFTTETISTNTLVDIYTDAYGVNPTEVTWTSTTMTLTFDAQESAVKVGVKITN